MRIEPGLYAGAASGGVGGQCLAVGDLPRSCDLGGRGVHFWVGGVLPVEGCSRRQVFRSPNGRSCALAGASRPGVTAGAARSGNSNSLRLYMRAWRINRDTHNKQVVVEGATMS